MLEEIRLKNFIIFEDERIEFKKGLNVITGETGSGKSIIIDAIQILCGARFAKEDIKSGEDKAIIEGVFQIYENNELNSIIKDLGISIESDNVLLIQREVNQSGRSQARINGHVVTLNMLKSVTEYIIDVVAQNEHQRLFNSSSHMVLVDNFSVSELFELKEKIHLLIDKIKYNNNLIKDLYGTSQERERKLDLLKYQINEIEKSNLRAGEVEDLKNKRTILVSAEKLFTNISVVYELLYDGQNYNKSIFDNLAECVNNLNAIKDIDSTITDFNAIVSNCLYQLEDLKHLLRTYRDDIEFNSNEINFIEERLSLIDGLSRKYGNTIEEIFEFKDRSKKEYERLISNKEEIILLDKELKELKKEYFIKAGRLSKMRESISKDIEKKVEKELKDLNMDGAKFFVKNNARKDFIGKDGIDKIEFYLSANPGEIEKPLTKVASGGEISRIMLALKTVLTNADNIDCIIFDEIDAGIGGLTANMVADKLKWISKKKQTICITHLAQIASLGDNHLHVNKYIEKDKTFATIKKITKEERIKELAKMIDGEKDSKLSIGLAKKLLDKN